jgi:phospholipase C
MFRRYVTALFLAAIVLTTASCGSGSVPSNPAGTVGSPLEQPTTEMGAPRHSGQIQHIVIVMQEARSFDDLFCGYPGSDGKCAHQTIPLEANCTLSDTFQDVRRERKSLNFGIEHAVCPGHPRPEYAHAPKAEVAPYYRIAQQYALGDLMFSSTDNPTFEAHQYLIAAQAGNAENEPFGKTSDGCVYEQLVHQLHGGKIDACFAYKTLGDELTEAGLTWSYYHTADRKHPIVDTWDAYGWIKGGSSGTSPSSKFIQDVAAGKLASVTWVTPSFADSDLSGSLSSCGPNWVVSVVNAVGESQFWNTSAIVILWSGFGGWYDHVPPPYVSVDGLGFRVPVLVVSPFARTGYVDHVQFETASVLRFVEDTFALNPLAASDRRAHDLGRSTINLDQQPKAFVPIQGGSGCSLR